MKKDRTSPPLKKKGYLKLAVFVACIAVLVIIAFVNVRSKQVHVSPERAVDPTVRNILGKMSFGPIPSRFSPVFIYRMAKGSHSTAQFAGSGSRFMGRGGEKIVTSEHLFSKGSGEQRYTYQSIRAKNRTVFGIEKVMNTGKEVSGGAGMADVVLLKTGEEKPILGFSIHTLGVWTSEIDVTPFTQAPLLRSLVTGEEVRMLGKITDPLGINVSYMMLDYPSIDGESGTGFVDKDDNLYVLKARMLDVKPEDHPGLGKFKAITFAYGPLNFKD